MYIEFSMFPIGRERLIHNWFDAKISLQYNEQQRELLAFYHVMNVEFKLDFTSHFTVNNVKNLWYFNQIIIRNRF